MSIITHVPEPNLWDVICRDFESRRSFGEVVDEDNVSVSSECIEFKSNVHNPVFYGKMHVKLPTDSETLDSFDPAIGHPAAVGYAFVDKPSRSPPVAPPTPPSHKQCTPRQYLEHYIFPVLLPALEEMLKQARDERCFERKRTKFNALDFLTEYLYKKNPRFGDRPPETELWDISFVQEWLKDHPRAPLPLSLLWTEEEATLVIQSHWRAYLVRREPDIQELRVWQREWRDVNANIRNKVDGFWAETMPENNGSRSRSETPPPPNISQEITKNTDESVPPT